MNHIPRQNLEIFPISTSNICPAACADHDHYQVATTKTTAKMVTKSKLKMALAAEKGTDFKKLKLLKKQKEAEKRNAAARGAAEEESSDDKEKTIEIEADFEDFDDEDEEEDDEEEEAQVCFSS